jgi:hypothetical protein
MGWLDIAGDVIGIGAGIADTYSSYKSNKDREDFYDDQAKISAKTAKRNAENVRKAAERNAELSVYDASVAIKEANQAFKSSENEARGFILQAGQFLGQQRTNYAKSGVAVSTGTPLEVNVKSGRELVRDALIIKYNGKTAANRAKEIANRYKKVSEVTLENAAEHAALIEEAGAYDSSYYGKMADASGTAAIFSGASTGLSNLYNIGTNRGWF